ncbi:MAG: hypothetical protein OEL56_00155 [Nitrosopumilus sp.]|nr:hypothetical protein [Nitrosopumilus sp.]MDH3515481.1 hypothetical protein [Nitrosopumilus sp.]MDH3565548.1 hypothetical protein [Nitrosopumilus sp.]MDH5416754.1 hypothetical protein [Nitrosopumilus sp.]MDH5555218.1 hypothetical protein [Nitrosopumilus sp.]
MTLFENFYHDLLELLEKYKSLNTPLRVEKDLENNIVKIFGENLTSLAKAQNGLNDVTELAYTTAEHHPYWNLIYNCAEITNSVLEKWTGQLTEDDLVDIDWSLKEINQTLEKIKTKNSSNF